MIHHPDNLIKIENGAGSWHSRINSAYQTYNRFPEIPPNISLRQWLRGRSFETQYEWGMRVLNETR